MISGTLNPLSFPRKITVIFSAFAFASLLCLARAADTPAADAAIGPAAAQPAVFHAESFTPVYGWPYENAIPLDALRALPLNIELRNGVYYPATTITSGAAAPTENRKLKTENSAASSGVTLGQSFPAGQFSESALLEIFQTIARYYNQRGIYGVFVVVNRDDIDPQTHEDYRPPERKDLRLTIWISRLGNMRTLAKGTRFTPAESVDNPAHRLIAQHSPLQPDPTFVRPGALLRKDLLDDYLLALNRQPARRVDAAISAGSDPGVVDLDYLVSERRPWFAYAQVSDSGSGDSDNLRYHAGFSHYQLSNHDDILQIDAATGRLSDGFSASASYDRPIIYPATLRGNVGVSYAEFTAEDLALGLDKFTGYSASANIGLAWSPVRVLGCFLDILPGLVWQRYHTYDSNLGASTGASFAAARLAARLQRNTDTYNASLTAGYETNFNAIPAADLAGLGRADATRGYNLLTLDAGGSFFVEPLLYGEKFYTGDSWRKSARAHEIALTARGQLSLDNNRLIPQKMMTLGGLYSVRGYPGSVISGDNVWMASLEYRLHIPRLFRPYTLPRDRGNRADAPAYFGIPFNWRAPAPHALPDWDFIARFFADAGRAAVIDPLSYEASRTIASIGVGLEAQVKGVLNIRVDWGFAQKPVQANGYDVKKNSSQVNFSASLLW